MAVARVLVARGRRAEAERAASAAAALADATDVSTEQAGNRAVLAEAFAAAGKAAEAVNALERAAGLCEAKGDLVTPPRMRARIEELRASACGVPKLCSHRMIIPICRRNRVLTPHADDAEKLRG